MTLPLYLPDLLEKCMIGKFITLIPTNRVHTYRADGNTNKPHIIRDKTFPYKRFTQKNYGENSYHLS